MVTEDWPVWLLAIGVAALFIGYFWWTGGALIGAFRSLVRFIEDWPQIRRAMVEAEARSGGRYPLWLRAARVTILLSFVALLVFVAWRKFG
jgi:hypothetical protein